MAVVNNLLVVESPTKARTIGRYLGGGYKVVATVGHLRDLPKSKMGVEINGGVRVEYVSDAAKGKVIKELKTAADKADLIYLATDPDREGEAIAWHVSVLLKKSKKTRRIVFHEITKQAVEEAIKNSGQIDMDLVNAQQGRRVLDRVVGYSLSPVLWKKVRRGLSAGRVQSVAVRLICEREGEREAFGTEKFFKILADLGRGKEKFGAELVEVGGKKFWQTDKIDLFDGSYSFTKTIFDSKAKADNFLAKLAKTMRVDKVSGRQVGRWPGPPFTTSRLQQAAAGRMGWSGKLTMSVAQRLYEQGLITYHRTDSVYLADKAVGAFRKFIEKEFGQNYVSQKVRVYKNKSKNAQEAHEAIRPTQVEVRVPKGVDSRGQKLYEMIWKQAVATQAAEAKLKKTTIVFDCGLGKFRSDGVQMLFDGFLKILGVKQEEQILPELKEGEEVAVKKSWADEGETRPPPRYNDATLVKSLEAQGIGRPSTYAPIISTIEQRQYVERDEGRFKPTVLGEGVNKFLVKNFLEVMSLPFTAGMEEDLDRVAQGKTDWQKMLVKFWKGFAPKIKQVEKEADRVKIEMEKLGKKCPKCKKGELVVRIGRFGKFISCDKFPECKYTASLVEEAGFVCPDCKAKAVVKKTKRGRKFFGCSQYPKCKWASWKKPSN